MVTSAKQNDPISDAILNAVRTRGNDARFGIGLASDYLKSVAPCFEAGNGLCPVDIFQLKSPDAWNLALKEAESKLVFHDSLMLVKEHSQTDLTEGSIMDFDGYLTTTQDDRDGDLLESKGASLDPMMPLLFNHIPMQPVGRLVKCLEQTSQHVFCKWALAGTSLGNDMAALVELKALRMSHGFRPTPGEFEPRSAKSSGQQPGWHIKKFGVYEGSLVPIPSNVGAIITAHSRKLLKSAFVDRWAKGFFDNRGVQGVGFDAAQLGTSPAPVGSTKDTSTSSAGGSVSNVSVMGSVGDAGSAGTQQAKPSSMLLSATCPKCGASFDMTTIPDGADLKKVTCPMCDAGGGSSQPDSSTGDQGQSNAGGGINQAAVTGATRSAGLVLSMKEGRVISASNHSKLTECHGCLENASSILKQVMEAASGNDLTSDMNDSIGDKSGAGAVSNLKQLYTRSEFISEAVADGPKLAKYMSGAIEPHLRGSFEWISTQLEAIAVTYLRGKGIAFTSDTRASILGTYATIAIVCVRDWSAETYPCYSMEWSLDENGLPEWSGDPKKVEIVATVVEKALAARSLSAAVQRAVADGVRMSTKAAKNIESELCTARDKASEGIAIISDERANEELAEMCAGLTSS